MTNNAPILLLEIEGNRLTLDMTSEIISFKYEDHEKEMDMLEVTITDPYLQLIDNPLLQEGKEIRARFGYVDDLSPTKIAVIKEIGYEFPDSGAPSITIKAFDKACHLTNEQVQRVWDRPGGIRASDIAVTIAYEHGLTPIVTTSIDVFPRLHQSKLSDAQWLTQLAKTARSSNEKGIAGYVFYIEGEELHFHPRGLEKAPVMVLEYFTSNKGILRSFRPQTNTQGAAAGGQSTKAVGINPKSKMPTASQADNTNTPDRPVLGEKSALTKGASSSQVIIDANTGRRK
jgi:phage protein D